MPRDYEIFALLLIALFVGAALIVGPILNLALNVATALGAATS